MMDSLDSWKLEVLSHILVTALIIGFLFLFSLQLLIENKIPFLWIHLLLTNRNINRRHNRQAQRLILGSSVLYHRLQTFIRIIFSLHCGIVNIKIGKEKRKRKKKLREVETGG